MRLQFVNMWIENGNKCKWMTQGLFIKTQRKVFFKIYMYNSSHAWISLPNKKPHKIKTIQNSEQAS